MTEEKTIVLEVDRETLAREYQAHGYPSYADLAREGEGSFTLCSLRAVAIARSDCIKVAQEEVDAAEVLLARHVHCSEGTRALLKAQLTTAKAILSRLESLKSPPPEQGEQK